jgi:WD40 repeat protein
MDARNGQAFVLDTDGSLTILGETDAGTASVGNGRTDEGVAEIVRAAPDGKLFATAGADGDVVLWEAPAVRRLATLHTPQHGGGTRVTALSFAPDGSRLVAVKAGTQYVFDLNIESLAARACILLVGQGEDTVKHTCEQLARSNHHNF